MSGDTRNFISYPTLGDFIPPAGWSPFWQEPSTTSDTSASKLRPLRGRNPESKDTSWATLAQYVPGLPRATGGGGEKRSLGSYIHLFYSPLPSILPYPLLDGLCRLEDPRIEAQGTQSLWISSWESWDPALDE